MSGPSRCFNCEKADIVCFTPPRKQRRSKPSQAASPGYNVSNGNERSSSAEATQLSLNAQDLAEPSIDPNCLHTDFDPSSSPPAMDYGESAGTAVEVKQWQQTLPRPTIDKTACYNQGLKYYTALLDLKGFRRFLLLEIQRAKDIRQRIGGNECLDKAIMLLEDSEHEVCKLKDALLDRCFKLSDDMQRNKKEYIGKLFRFSKDFAGQSAVLADTSTGVTSRVEDQIKKAYYVLARDRGVSYVEQIADGLGLRGGPSQDLGFMNGSEKKLAYEKAAQSLRGTCSKLVNEYPGVGTQRLKAFLQKKPASLLYSPTHLAYLRRDVALVLQPEERDFLDRNILHYACHANDEAFVLKLLEECDGLAESISPDLLGMTPLLYAAMNGNERLCAELIGNGAPREYDGPEVLNVAHVAAASGSTSVIEWLARTQNIPASVHLSSICMTAIKNNREETADVMLQYLERPSHYNDLALKDLAVAAEEKHMLKLAKSLGNIRWPHPTAKDMHAAMHEFDVDMMDDCFLEGTPNRQAIESLENPSSIFGTSQGPDRPPSHDSFVPQSADGLTSRVDVQARLLHRHTLPFGDNAPSYLFVMSQPVPEWPSNNFSASGQGRRMPEPDFLPR